MPEHLTKGKTITPRKLVSIIAAIDQKRGIGKNGDLLIKIPEDFKRMRLLTSGHPIIMGRKTYESIGRILPERTNIIVTRKTLNLKGAIISHSLDEAFVNAQKSPGSSEIFIFGGGQLFTQALNLGIVDKLYLTIIKNDFSADTFFPEYSEFKKTVYKKEGVWENMSYTFLELEK